MTFIPHLHGEEQRDTGMVPPGPVPKALTEEEVIGLMPLNCYNGQTCEYVWKQTLKGQELRCRHCGQRRN